MRIPLAIIVLTIFQSCDPQSTTGDRVASDQVEYPKLVFTEGKDSLRVLMPGHYFQKVDLVLGIDSVGIIGGQEGKFECSHIKSSLTLKVDSSMFFHGKIDGAFRCWDSIKDLYRWYPVYGLYKKQTP